MFVEVSIPDFNVEFSIYRKDQDRPLVEIKSTAVSERACISLGQIFHSEYKTVEAKFKKGFLGIWGSTSEL